MSDDSGGLGKLFSRCERRCKMTLLGRPRYIVNKFSPCHGQQPICDASVSRIGNVFYQSFTSEVHRHIERVVTRTIVIDMTTACGARKMHKGEIRRLKEQLMPRILAQGCE